MVLFKFEFYVVNLNLIPHMWQMVFAYVFVQGWINDPNEHWFFDQPEEILLLPAHYTEVVQVGSVTSGVTVVMDRGGGF